MTSPKPRAGGKVKRIAIVFDGTAWFIRRIRVIEHDLERDEVIYRCDHPIANDLRDLDAVLRELPAVKSRGRKSK